MPTFAQVEEQIYTCEGFRVRLTPLKPGTKTLPPYDFLVMAPQRWRISDWKMARLRAYVPFVRDVAVLRGDDGTVKTDLQLGNLRDSYYQAKYGSLAADATTENATVTVLTQKAAPSADAPDEPSRPPRPARTGRPRRNGA